jgi:hypothetical protein
MSVGLTWLDTNADEQRKMREIIALFSQQESRDELGIGQIRDVFSDSLFPGTSVLLTRARYFLIVPWVFRLAAQRGREGAPLRDYAEYTERRLIERLRATGVTDGLIGVRAGKNVKNLPSAIYWSGLRTYGVLRSDKAPDSLSALVTRGRTIESDELAVRAISDWDPEIPPAPGGFPEELPNGLDLAPPEATWLKERILAAVAGTLLAELLTANRAPDPGSEAPWRDSMAANPSPEVRAVLNHAELFSLAIRGAALLYNAQIGEKYEAVGLTRIEEPVERHRVGYEDWLQDIDDAGHRLSVWDMPDFWSRVTAVNPRISPSTRLFVDAWVKAVVSAQVPAGMTDRSLRDLVARREQSIKRGQSRLTNDKLLRTWSGESGSGRLVYRWPVVRRILTDIHEPRSTDAGT